MDFSRLRTGHLVAGIAGILLFISMFLNWYEVKITIGGQSISLGGFGGSFNAFDNPGFLGGIADLLIIAAVVIVVGLVALAAAGRAIELPAPPGTLIMAAGGGAAVIILLRMLFQPGPNDIVSLKLWIFVAFILALATAVGGWLVAQEEGAAPRAGTPPPPVPPASGGPTSSGPPS